MTKYPSLYAALEPSDHDGHRGSTVRCTASRRALGFVWWSCNGSNVVTWHYVAHGQADHGTRNTERNAVQALRDIANVAAYGWATPLVTETEPAPAVARPAARRVIQLPASSTESSPVVVAPAPAPARIVWDDDDTDDDVTAALAAAFARNPRFSK